jgi:hypothetical protein
MTTCFEQLQDHVYILHRNYNFNVYFGFNFFLVAFCLKYMVASQFSNYVFVFVS